MSRLHRLVADHIRELSGAQFKIAVYLLCRLEHRREVRTDIETLAQATGVSWRQTQSALRKLAKKGILRIESRRHRGTVCSLPAVSDGTRAGQSTSPSRRRSTPQHSKRLSAVPADARPAAPTRKTMPATPIPVASESVEAGPRVMAPAPVPPSTTTASAAPAGQYDGQAAKEREAHGLVRKLLRRRYNVAPTEFQSMVDNADGNLDRLIKRLRDLADYNQYETVAELCAAIRSLVLIR